MNDPVDQTIPLENYTAIALSGGGFRATLFHLGVLWRLNELGLIPKIDRFVSVSGASILTAYLGMRWRHLRFEEGVASNFDSEIVSGIRDFCTHNVDVRAFLRHLLPWRLLANWPGNSLEKSYRVLLYGEATLADLPDAPAFVIVATNLITGTIFRFRKSYVGEYRTGLIRQPWFRLSEAVGASSAFPPPFSPYRLKVKPKWFGEPGDMHHAITNALYLSDGGVIDNIGIEPLWRRASTVLISDAGAPPRFEKAVRTRWSSFTKRAIDIATSQAEPSRKRMLIEHLHDGRKRGAYWSINSPPDPQLTGGLVCNPTLTVALARMRTRLNSFTDLEQCTLINWGYAASDAAIRRYWLPAEAVRTSAWPYPKFSLEQAGLLRYL